MYGFNKHSKLLTPFNEAKIFVPQYCKLNFWWKFPGKKTKGWIRIWIITGNSNTGIRLQKGYGRLIIFTNFET